MSHQQRTSKRARTSTAHYSLNESVSREEEKLFQQALSNSVADSNRNTNLITDIQSAPIFYPTIAEFSAGPLSYIRKIKEDAERFGICKIVPPVGWNPPFAVNMNSTKRFETKKQVVNRLAEGISFKDGKMYTPAEYQNYASASTKKWKNEHYANEDMTSDKLEKDYWDILETGASNFTAEYGNDIDCTSYWSGFPTSRKGRSINNNDSSEIDNTTEPSYATSEFYRETWWNLNNIPASPGSVLRHVKVPLNGVNVPWLYMGTLFSTFCWHNEDNYLYSINYHHTGAGKQWYGVPGTKKDSEGLERIFKNVLAMKMKDAPDLIHDITTMFSPRLLLNAKVPVCKVVQNPGEFIVTFPRAFHSGFSLGPNCGEAVNFATPDWISHGADANERYRGFGRPTVFSHDRLTFTIAQYLEEHSAQSCSMLRVELSRVLSEERNLRDRLVALGVRDVSHEVKLPPNRLDQLDTLSADYDDKRLCHACQHICFFSAVACECSKSKVSCLRHSHSMCRCDNSRKYLLVWAQIKEMEDTLKLVSTQVRLLTEKALTEEFEVDVGKVKSKALELCRGATDERVEALREKFRVVNVGPAGHEKFPILGSAMGSEKKKWGGEFGVTVEPTPKTSPSSDGSVGRGSDDWVELRAN